MAEGDDDDEMELSQTELESTSVHLSRHIHQISMEQYKQESYTYTQEAVKKLKNSTDYKFYTQRCHRYIISISVLI